MTSPRSRLQAETASATAPTRTYRQARRRSSLDAEIRRVAPNPVLPNDDRDVTRAGRRPTSRGRYQRGTDTTRRHPAPDTDIHTRLETRGSRPHALAPGSPRCGRCSTRRRSRSSRRLRADRRARIRWPRAVSSTRTARRSLRCRQRRTRPASSSSSAANGPSRRPGNASERELAFQVEKVLR